MKRRISRTATTYRGFTLIELLVVISIIGMLSSVVLASVQSARDKGRIASGLVFERHTKDAFGDKILAEYNFDTPTGCPNGYQSVTQITTIPNVWGSSNLNLNLLDPNLFCNNVLSSDTPTSKGSSLNIPKFVKYYLDPTNTGTSFTNFSIGFWIKASSAFAQTRSIEVVTSGSTPLDVSLDTDLSSATTPFIGNMTSPVSCSGFVNLSPGKLVDNKWHYVFVAVNGVSGTKVYFDGKKDSSGASCTPGALSSASSISVNIMNTIGSPADNANATLLIDNLVLIGDAP